MPTRPRDVTDLYLAPVALELDRRLEGLSGLSDEELDVQITLSTDRQPNDTASRAALAIESLTHVMDLHGWQVQWDPRGLRIRNDQHSVVLGIPASLRRYLAE
jgi:hypothetical protein